MMNSDCETSELFKYALLRIGDHQNKPYQSSELALYLNFEFSNSFFGITFNLF